MSDESASTERNRNLWAPWRMAYIDTLSDAVPKDGCFLCRYREDPADDATNLVLFRGAKAFVVMNRFPYSSGHCLVAPYIHVAGMEDLDEPTMLEIMLLLRDTQAVLGQTLHCEGFNVGINIGRCAGAGLPGHLHMHIVPRWGGDTNFMSVLGAVRVMPQTLEQLYDQILAAAENLGVPAKR